MHQILADTNILQYGVSKLHADLIAKIYETLKQESYVLTVSDYTVFEIYRGLAINRIRNVKNLVDDQLSINVDNQTFKIAAALSTCYRRHDSTKVYADRYSDGDIVLAATAFRHNMLLLTANGNDFPRPFFEELAMPSITKVVAKSKLNIVVLRPDIMTFNKIVGDYFRD